MNITKEELKDLPVNIRAAMNKELRAVHNERNLEAAWQHVADHLEEKALIDCLEELHSILLKDIMPNADLGVFRREAVYMLNESENFALKEIKANQDEIKEEIQSLKQALQGFKGLERLALEHVGLLDIHPFTDGNGRVCRFILAVGLMRMGAKYCYGFLKKDDEYKDVMEEVFRKQDSDIFLKYLRNMVHFN